MTTAHHFQTPRVEPMFAGCEQPPTPVLLRVAPADAKRILRALDETSRYLAPAPGGSPGAGAYRRLAAEIRAQTNVARHA